MHKVNLAKFFPDLTAPWSPITVGQCNGADVMLAKGEGSYPWHRHDAQVETYFMLIEPPATKDSGTTMV